ncbi:MAG: NIPSNAP family protein [Candidatus Competibacterales bacterium]
MALTIGRPSSSSKSGVCNRAADAGDVNSYVPIWAFASAADRAEKRRAKEADPAWIAHLEKSATAGYLVSQVNKILTPVDFFVSKGHK